MILESERPSWFACSGVGVLLVRGRIVSSRLPLLFKRCIDEGRVIAAFAVGQRTGGVGVLRLSNRCCWFDSSSTVLKRACALGLDIDVGLVS